MTTLDLPRPAAITGLAELRFLTESTALMDLHRDAHRIMGSTDNQRRGWIFRWDDLGTRRVVTIRGRADGRPGFNGFSLPAAGRPFRFSLAVRAVHRRVRTRTETMVELDEMPDWLGARMRGLTLSDLTFDATTAVLGKAGRPARLPYWDVSGHAVIEDIEAATTVFADGVGRGRGFGFGMVAPY